MTPPNKILIALQFWDGDKVAAMKLARLMADLEPQFCDKADFLFSARYDCGHDQDTVAYTAKKFNTYTYVNSHRRASGWPHGCNELWFGTMGHVFWSTEANRMPEYKAILTCESDCIPMHPGWIEALINSWDRAKVSVLGSMLSQPGVHINGNAMFSGSPRFLKWLTHEVVGCRPNGGWDILLAPAFQKWGWLDCRAMRSWWRCPTMPVETYEQLLSEKVSFFHGCKDDSGLLRVRERFLR